VKREINTYRETDPKPGELVRHIYPGWKKPLPQVGEACTMFNLQTGNVFAVRVVHVNRKLHIYDVLVKEGWELQPRLL